MRVSKHTLILVLGAAIAALSMAFAAGAVGSTGNRGHRSHQPSNFDHPGQPGHRRHGVGRLIPLAPSVPTDPTFHGVAPGGAPWALTRGAVRLTRGGRLDLRVRGLVLTSTGTAGPVTTISASLYCGDNSDTTAAATTQQVPLSTSGNARIHDPSFTLPSTCLAPVILVHPNGKDTAYIAVDGWQL